MWAFPFFLRNPGLATVYHLFYSFIGHSRNGTSRAIPTLFLINSSFFIADCFPNLCFYFSFVFCRLRTWNMIYKRNWIRVSSGSVAGTCQGVVHLNNISVFSHVRARLTLSSCCSFINSSRMCQIMCVRVCCTSHFAFVFFSLWCWCCHRHSIQCAKLSAHISSRTHAAIDN